MSAEILLLAAGTGERWEAKYPKHLSQIAGVPLIRRTIEQLAGHGIRPWVVTSNAELAGYITHNDMAEIWHPQSSRWTAETLYSTRELWKDTTIVLLGDVVFSGEDLAKTLEPQEYIAVYHNARIGELFAIRFEQRHNERVEQACQAVIKEAEQGTCRAKMWEWYYVIREEGGVKGVRLLNTADVDTIEDWRYINDNIANKMSLAYKKGQAK